MYYVGRMAPPRGSATKKSNATHLLNASNVWRRREMAVPQQKDNFPMRDMMAAVFRCVKDRCHNAAVTVPISLHQHPIDLCRRSVAVFRQRTQVTRSQMVRRVVIVLVQMEADAALAPWTDFDAFYAPPARNPVAAALRAINPRLSASRTSQRLSPTSLCANHVALNVCPRVRHCCAMAPNRV